MRRIRVPGSLVLLAALTLTGCNSSDDDSATTTSTTGDASTSSTTDAPATPKVVLLAEGLGVATFGDQKTAVVATLTAAFGAPDETGEGCELAGTDVTTTSWKELTVQFADGELDAYDVQVPESESSALDLKTEEGIGVGSTVAQLKAAYGDRLTIPGLPPEFGTRDSFAISFSGSEEALLGHMDGPADSDRVESFFTQLCE
ncbi:MAG: hypothetical protein ACR2MO_00820 [Acidimicrobiales bacterium]